MSPHHPRRSPDVRKVDRVSGHSATEKRTSERIRYLSHYDPLTSLSNRAFFRTKLRKSSKRAEEKNLSLAVLFLSLDPYPRINETLGPAMGDRLVRCVAKRLKEFIGGNAAVGYWGSGTFVLLLDAPGQELQVAEIVRQIKKRIERRFFSFKQEFFLTTTVGVALCPSNGLTAEALLKSAGAALLEAQQCGGNCCRFYTADLNAISLKRFALENQLGRAIQRRQFTLHYQAQIQTGSRQITSAEALIRWEHPKLGTIPPADFVPLAENTGLIIPIGDWVLRTACHQLRHWHSTGLPDLSLAINVSARQLQERESVDSMIEIIRDSRLDPECLELELTESSLVTNTEDVIESLRRLKNVGVNLAIDDFGTGFSSLEYLRKLSVDTLKIDKAFVRDSSNPDGAALVSSIISLARGLRLRVIAEGVETEDQLNFLERLGCDSMQGYLFSRPLPAEQFRRLLTGSNHAFKQRNDFDRALVAS